MTKRDIKGEERQVHKTYRTRRKSRRKTTSLLHYNQGGYPYAPIPTARVQMYETSFTINIHTNTLWLHNTLFRKEEYKTSE